MPKSKERISTSESDSEEEVGCIVVIVAVCLRFVSSSYYESLLFVFVYNLIHAALILSMN